MSQKICFFTVTGGGVDYEFLLGSILHHAGMGDHVVLDTTPAGEARGWKNLPPTVRWIHEPIYGQGWKEFKLRSATERAMNLALEGSPDVLVYLDSDEFFSADCAQWAFPLAYDRMVEVKTLTWLPNGKCMDFGESEWHRRIWPARMAVEILRNDAWIAHPQYNGNPEHHPIPSPAKGGKIIRAHGPFHHHLHYAIGKKAGDLETAVTTIPEWATGGVEVAGVGWPEPLRDWKLNAVKPSNLF